MRRIQSGFTLSLLFAVGCTTNVDPALQPLQAPSLEPLPSAYRALVDGEASPMRVEYRRAIGAVECQQRGFASGCLELCTAVDSPLSTPKSCRVIALADAPPAGTVLQRGRLCTKDRCLPASVHVSSTNVRTLLVKETLTSTSGNIGRLVGAPPAVSSVVAVIPPFVYDWVTGTEGQCCNDCWATHRSWGLACWMDNACCMGTCGVQPGCGAGGGPGGGGTTPGGNDSCGPSFSVTGASVSYNGMSCTFDGTVNPTLVDGVCIDVLGEGTIYDCVTTVGGTVSDPKETQDPDGTGGGTGGLR